MSSFRSFFISAADGADVCEELNAFVKRVQVVRLIENCIATGQCQGIQVLVEYKEQGESSSGGSKSKRVDWRASLKTDREKAIFDKLKAFRANLAKEKKLAGAYMICKDEHLAAIVQNEKITLKQIQELPHANNIMLKDYAQVLYDEFQKLLTDETYVPPETNEQSNLQSKPEPKVASSTSIYNNETGEFTFWYDR